MEKRGLSESALARRINPRSQSRTTVRRLLDPKSKSATIATVARAASAMNYRVEFKLVPTRAPRKGAPALPKTKPRPARTG